MTPQGICPCRTKTSCGGAFSGRAADHEAGIGAGDSGVENRDAGGAGESEAGHRERVVRGVRRRRGAWIYEALIADKNVDAVYIPLPNEMHKPWVFAAADAGKHVLCEKPLALDADEAEEMVARCNRGASC